MDKLAESVLEHIRQRGFLRPGDRVGVAVSGGADSVALLRLLLELRQELGVVLCVVHFNHNLRGSESDVDEQFVSKLAESYGLELHCGRGDVQAHAQTRRMGTEAAGRQLRYQYFHQLMADYRLNRIATGHTLDDQAETVLLRLVRGAGTRGLAGIYPELVHSELANPDLVNPNSPKPEFAGDQLIEYQLPDASSPFSVVRPLLGIPRAQLEVYLRGIGQNWREDSSNRDLRYARNQIRHGIVPRLQRMLNPNVKETLAETAEIAREEEKYWQKEVEQVLPRVWKAQDRTLNELAARPLALQRRLVRAAAESLGLTLEFRHIDKILAPDSVLAKAVALPDGWLVTKTRDGLKFEIAGNPSIFDYEYVLAVPGMVQVPEAGTRFEAAIVPGTRAPGYNPDHVIDPALLENKLTVRNWRAGDRFWPAHTKAPKKIKELLQERKLGAPERKLWPVIISGNEIVWVRGFATPARLRPREGAKQALVIQEYSKA